MINSLLLDLFGWRFWVGLNTVACFICVYFISSILWHKLSQKNRVIKTIRALLGLKCIIFFANAVDGATVLLGYPSPYVPPVEAIINISVAVIVTFLALMRTQVVIIGKRKEDYPDGRRHEMWVVK